MPGKRSLQGFRSAIAQAMRHAIDSVLRIRDDFMKFRSAKSKLSYPLLFKYGVKKFILINTMSVFILHYQLVNFRY
jgi:hypothetical protein